MNRGLTITAFILAGGASSRMGCEKGLLEFGGEPLIASTARMLEPLAREVIVVGAPDRYSRLGLRTVPDRAVFAADRKDPLRTPLVGIATALSVTTSPWNLMLACDLPYLTLPWVRWFLGRTRNSNAQIVMPRTSGGLEPLAAAYRRECASPILTALERGVCKVTEVTSELQTEIVEERDWGELDPDGCVLKNMNTPADYQEAKKWRKRRGSRG